MPLLKLEGACLAFGHVALLDHADLQLDAGERVALIGRNGSGKSSLLRLLAGTAAPDDGGVWREPGLKLALVPQEPQFEAGGDCFAAVAGGLGEASRLLNDYHLLLHEVAGAGGDASLGRLQELQHALEQADAWRLNTRVEQTLSRIGIDGAARVDTLSGGQLKRLALARALVSSPDALLLDEPTNHLDLDGIAWLEELVSGFAGAVVVVTHDRRFLDAVATRIVELDRGRLASYPGSYGAYQTRKREQLDAEAAQAAKFDKLLAQEEVWIRKGIEARRTRNEGRVRRLEQLRRVRGDRRERLGQVSLQLERGDSSGKLVAELEGAGKRYGERWIVRNFSTRIQRGDRIGIIGPNGAGKTTLLRLILGQLQPDEGKLRLGSRLAVAYFDQFRTQLDPEATLSDVISPGSDWVEVGGARKHVIGYLEDFLFAPERARSPVKSLSGGERNRLLLARLFSQPANLLVLDEPTNDLDIETLELLEALLQDYDGTVMLVSHDRAFLDNVVTQVFAVEPPPAAPGTWKEYAGGYDDWLRQRTPPAAPPPKPAPATVRPAAEAPRRASARSGKLGFNEKRELAGLPDRIAQLEAELAALQARLADPATYREPAEALARLNARLAELDGLLAQAMARWEALESRAGG
ncbi:MAG: ATP-binding cassette domain-containing protein [Sterolibacteriaceae bacterium]|nr:ATP-binding cassette domain-containing protein [Candidatus Methylophosphatis haderslevensis]